MRLGIGLGLGLAADPASAPPTPVQANYITQQDVGNGYWTLGAMTPTSPDTLHETTQNAQHSIINTAVISGTLVGKTFTAWVEATPINGRNWLLLQVFDQSFASQAHCYFDLANVASFFPVASGTGWSISNVAMTPIPGSPGKVRCQFDITIGATSTSTGFKFFPQMQPDQPTNSYPGDITKGARFSNMWLFNRNAAPGGS